ncbi:FtsX-like permease family protein [Clostridium sp. CF011]|uniref:ABC transporter permease n=1 Tax=unclassified Clostridium TaxID=2614128 RepID=UPI001C0BF1A9|nr:MULTISPECIES: FtsX-like permease family protein [unclassified Clostridium]MBU3092280.1 FtsX-like permease family protein [Clostridium sp. CF011]MBW9145525.1 FtsX-like permease family protein [Clostridium sp. CM027]UVE42360.1 FtsX-like permease family protein [Clostridium sp. CM027]WAG71379.1 FtsX-like permease family protein [Clostridium sp. CF011]
MNPLSPFKYIKNNTSKILPILMSIMVGVLLIYFYSLINKSATELTKITATNIFSKYTTVASNSEEPISKDYLDKITNDNNVDYIVPLIGEYGFLQYSGFLGGMSIDVINFYEKDISRIITTLDMKLIQGRLPRTNKNEIIIPKKYALQNELKTGDYIGSEVSDSYGIEGKFKVSGITDGPVMLAVVSDNKDNVPRSAVMKNSIVFHVKNIKDKNLINYLSKDTPKNILIRDYYSVSKQYDEILKPMNSLSFMLNMIIIVVLFISLGNLNYINFLNRKYEFGVLLAIGYKKSTLYFKLWKENFTVCLLGYICGILLTTFITFILNLTVLYPTGKFIPLWSISGAKVALFIPIIVSFLSLIAPIKELRKTDPIDVIGG